MHPVSGRQDLYSPSEHYCMFQVGSLHGHRRRLGTRCLTPSLQAVPIPKISMDIKGIRPLSWA